MTLRPPVSATRTLSHVQVCKSSITSTSDRWCDAAENTAVTASNMRNWASPLTSADAAPPSID